MSWFKNKKESITILSLVKEISRLENELHTITETHKQSLRIIENMREEIYKLKEEKNIEYEIGSLVDPNWFI